MKFFMLLLCFVLLYTSGWILEIDGDCKCLIIWMIYRTISLLWSQDYSTPKSHFLSLVLVIFFICVLQTYKISKKTIIMCMNAYWIASGLMGIMSLFFSEAYLGTSYARQVLTLFGSQMDPNNQAAMLLVGVTISLYKIFFKRDNKAEKVIAFAVAMINLYSCLLTASRAGLITIAILVVMCVFLSESKEYRILKTIGKSILMMLIIYVLYLVVNRYLPTASFERIFTFESYESGSYRAEMWTNVWKLFTTDLFSILFGTGWGTSVLYTGTDLGAHNTFLIMLCDVGVLGTGAFCIPIIKNVIRCIKGKEIFPILFLVSQFIPALFIDATNKRFFWNAVIILFFFATATYSTDEYDVLEV